MDNILPPSPAKSTHTPKLTQEYLKSILNYDPETGVFTWKERSDVPKGWNTRYAGKEAGYKRKYKNTSYIYIKIKGNHHAAHGLAWLYMTGDFAELGLEIDHIDCNPENNSFENLRLATRTQNQANSRVYKTNKLGIKGVRRKGNRYIAQIMISGRRIHLGSFNTPQEASVAYAKAAEKHFGEFARVS